MKGHEWYLQYVDIRGGYFHSCVITSWGAKVCVLILEGWSTSVTQEGFSWATSVFHTSAEKTHPLLPQCCDCRESILPKKWQEKELKSLAWKLLALAQLVWICSIYRETSGHNPVTINAFFSGTKPIRALVYYKRKKNPNKFLSMNMQLVTCLKDKQHNHDAKFFTEPVGMKFEAAFISKHASPYVFGLSNWCLAAFITPGSSSGSLPGVKGA